MADVEFFFDPVCPWAWVTSRWVVEVGKHRPLDVTWRFIALRIVNEHRDYDREYPPRHLEGHTAGLRLLRVAAALRDREGPWAVGPFYTEVGAAIHVDRRRDEFVNDDAALKAILKDLGHDAGYADAMYESIYDDAVRADTAVALERAGKDVGTPIITFGAPDGPSFFGPVISRVPRGAEAVEMWATVERMARSDGFFELKRSNRERPTPER